MILGKGLVRQRSQTRSHPQSTEGSGFRDNENVLSAPVLLLRLLANTRMLPYLEVKVTGILVGMETDKHSLSIFLVPC